MASPTNRQEFIQYCMRRLGAPVIEINVDEDQVEDRIDDALRYYWDYHFDGSEKTYYKHQITNQDKINKYLTIPENINGVVSVFPIGDPSMRTQDMFNIQYQIALNDLYTLTSTSMVPYYMTRQHLSMMSEILVGKQPIRYNRHRNIVHIETDWNNFNTGDYLLIEAYEVVDPDVYSNVWKDRWLMQYATALIKLQWGNNISKFSNVQMIGGTIMNSDKILDDARQEIAQLENEMISSYSLPVSDMIG